VIFLSFFLNNTYTAMFFQMCARINNVMFMSSCLEWYYRYLGNTFGVFGDLSVKQHGHSGHQSISSTDMVKSGRGFIQTLHRVSLFYGNMF